MASHSHGHGSSRTASSGPSSSMKSLLEFLEEDESPTARTLFIGNIDERVTRKIIFELMVQVGPVEAIRLCPPRDGRTIAFVRYEHAVSVRYALLAFQDIKLFRSSVTMNFSGSGKNNPRPEHPSEAPTFFEIPPGFGDSPGHTKSSMSKRKIIPDVKEYHTGYYLQTYAEDDYDYHDDRRSSANHSNESDSRHHMHQLRGSKRHRSDYHTPANNRDAMSYHNDKKNGTYHDDRKHYRSSEEHHRTPQHIRFDSDDYMDSKYCRAKHEPSQRDSPVKGYSGSRDDKGYDRRHNAGSGKEKSGHESDRHLPASKRERVRSRHGN